MRLFGVGPLLLPGWLSTILPESSGILSQWANRACLVLVRRVVQLRSRFYRDFSPRASHNALRTPSGFLFFARLQACPQLVAEQQALRAHYKAMGGAWRNFYSGEVLLDRHDAAAD